MMDFSLLQAAQNDLVHVVQALLRMKANVHTSGPKWLDENPDLPLRKAARLGHTETVRVLLKAGADVHASGSDWGGGSPKPEFALRWAVRNGHTETVRVLLKAGANVHAFRDFALRYAAENGHTDMVRVLLEHKADVHACDENGSPDGPLRLSVYHGYRETACTLLRAGSDVKYLFESYVKTNLTFGSAHNSLENLGLCLRLGQSILRAVSRSFSVWFGMDKFESMLKTYVDVLPSECCRDECELILSYV